MSARHMILLVGAVALLGCAAHPEKFESAYYLDQEWGMAQMQSWDAQVLNRQPARAEAVPEGMDGIHAEPVVKTLHEGYKEKPQRLNIADIGIIGK